MKGLLIKDLYLLTQRKRTLIIFAAVCLIMGLTTDSSFVVGYMCILSVIIAVSTISYDEADNGMPFLMTLPVGRKTYVLSKYVMGILFCAAAWIAALLMLSLLQLVKSSPASTVESFGDALIFLPMAFLILDLMIPLQLKYGAEKSRTVMLILFGGITAIGLLGKAVFLKGDAGTAFWTGLERLSPSLVSLSMLGAAAILTAISIAASRRIMEKKTF